MALTRLTNKTDKHGNLIQQIIISDEEENHFKRLAKEIAILEIEADHERSGSPESPRKRASRNFKLNMLIWVGYITVGLLTTGLVIKLLILLGVQVNG